MPAGRKFFGGSETLRVGVRVKPVEDFLAHECSVCEVVRMEINFFFFFLVKNTYFIISSFIIVRRETTSSSHVINMIFGIFSHRLKSSESLANSLLPSLIAHSTRRPLEMDPQMNFRISEWPINRVVSTENLDIAYSIQQLARIFGLAVFTSRIRIFHSDKIRQCVCQA